MEGAMQWPGLLYRAPSVRKQAKTPKSPQGFRVNLTSSLSPER